MAFFIRVACMLGFAFCSSLLADEESTIDGAALVSENCFSCHRSDNPDYPDHSFGWVYRRSYSAGKWRENVDRMNDYAIKGEYIDAPWTPDQRQAMVEFLVQETNDQRSRLQEVGMGHFAVVHFPIALLLVVGLFDVVSLVARYPVRRDAIHAILGVAALSSLLAAGLGLALVWESLGLSEDLTDHRNAGFATAIFAVLAFTLREWRVRAPWAILRIAYLAVLFLAIGSASAAGHLGGMLIHGEYDVLSALRPADATTSDETK